MRIAGSIDVTARVPIVGGRGHWHSCDANLNFLGGKRRRERRVKVLVLLTEEKWLLTSEKFFFSLWGKHSVGVILKVKYKNCFKEKE